MPLARQERFTVTDDLPLLREVAVYEPPFRHGAKCWEEMVKTHTLPHTLAQMRM